MERLCEEIYQKLIFHEKNYSKYTKCLVRKIELLVSGKPEEIVRQVLLYFLINESGLFPNLIDIKVEHNSWDVAIYKNLEEENFKPLQPPSVIIEVKREEANLLNSEDQILRYLRGSHSEIGILFNGKKTIVYKKNELGDFIAKNLGSIADIPNVIQQGNTKIKQDLLDFKKAQDGDVNSFINLTKNYGKYATNQFIFRLKTSSNLLIGCFFSYDRNNIYYDIYGHYSKKKLSFKYSEFEKLISIIY